MKDYVDSFYIFRIFAIGNSLKSIIGLSER